VPLGREKKKTVGERGVKGGKGGGGGLLGKRRKWAGFAVGKGTVKTNSSGGRGRMERVIQPTRDQRYLVGGERLQQGGGGACLWGEK